MMQQNPRIAAAPVDDQFLDRWSPRAFADKPIAETTLRSLFEAARWAPSSANGQPWLFLCAAEPDDLAVFGSLLDEGNRRWALQAPVLIYVLCRRIWPKSGRANDWAKFDAGAAWMSLALQARELGLYAHAMAGFDRDRAYEILRVPQEEFEIIAAVAVGYYGDPSQLPEDLQQREKPSMRKPPAEVYKMGRF